VAALRDSLSFPNQYAGKMRGFARHPRRAFHILVFCLDSLWETAETNFTRELDFLFSWMYYSYICTFEDYTFTRNFYYHTSVFRIHKSI